MKFAMYLIDLEEPAVHGSNDSDAIRAFIGDRDPESFLILHGTYGQVQVPGEEAEEVEELPDPEAEDGEDDGQGEDE